MSGIRLASGESAAGEASARGDVIVLIDALRATTTITTALAHGIRAVIPVAKVEDCIGELTAGERGGQKLPGVDLDNSPRSFLSDSHRGKRLTITTTNGTRCLEAAATHPMAIVLLGAFVNLTATARAAERIAAHYGKDITMLAAGRLKEDAVEDNLTAELMAEVIRSGEPAAPSDIHLKTFLEGGSGRNLLNLGLREDIDFCARLDEFDLVPVYRNGKCRPLAADEPPLHGFPG
ncbi:2-phosphosulfolactate phosphatase [Haloferula helveola]|uniref:Probable 2-phosphosulfolactate phosphatase n=1 Tax=Haloferula helveola TaxID=490095 RepID=A0ABM7RJ56_9BACT|nr:2-phosphosulfolactate phosphatase [Haloferula helveola]